MTATIEAYSAPELGTPAAPYSNVVGATAGKLISVAGMMATDAQGGVVGERDFTVQTERVFANIAVALRAAGAGWSSVMQFTTYIVNPDDIPAFMAFRGREFPKMFPDGRYPTNTFLVVSRLVREAFLIEVQTLAAL